MHPFELGECVDVDVHEGGGVRGIARGRASSLPSEGDDSLPPPRDYCTCCGVVLRYGYRMLVGSKKWSPVHNSLGASLFRLCAVLRLMLCCERRRRRRL